MKPDAPAGESTQTRTARNRPKMFSRGALVRIALGLLTAVGVGLAVDSSIRLSAMQADYNRLARSAGYLAIEDPGKIWIAAIPTEEELVWRFRVYVPAGSTIYDVHQGGLISAKRLRNVNPWAALIGRSEGGEYQITLAFVKEGDRWTLQTNSLSGKCWYGSHAPQELLESTEPPHVEFAASDGPRAFAVDEPICVFRIRGTKPVEDVNGADPLYWGYHYYFVPQATVDAIWAPFRGGPPLNRN